MKTDTDVMDAWRLASFSDRSLKLMACPESAHTGEERKESRNYTRQWLACSTKLIFHAIETIALFWHHLWRVLKVFLSVYPLRCGSMYKNVVTATASYPTRIYISKTTRDIKTIWYEQLKVVTSWALISHQIALYFILQRRKCLVCLLFIRVLII